MAKSSKSLKIAKSMKQTTKLSKVTKGATKSSKFKQILDFSTYISYAQTGGEFYASTSRFLRPVMKSRVYTFIAGRLLNNFRN
jgi:hypothetical protein